MFRHRKNHDAHNERAGTAPVQIPVITKLTDAVIVGFDQPPRGLHVDTTIAGCAATAGMLVHPATPDPAATTIAQATDNTHMIPIRRPFSSPSTGSMHTTTTSTKQLADRQHRTQLRELRFANVAHPPIR